MSNGSTSDLQNHPNQSTIHPAYLAGIFDGEGHIGIVTQRGAFYLHCTICNNYTPLLEQIKLTLGGGSLIEKPGKNYQLNLVYSPAEFLIELIQPFVVIKQAQIELALRFLKTYRKYGKRWHPLTESELEEYQWFKDEISRINKLGGRTDLEISN